MIEIGFREGAEDSADQALGRLEGYTVKVFPEHAPANAAFDARLIEVDIASGWHGTVLVQRINPLNHDEMGPPESVAVRRVEVY